MMNLKFHGPEAAPKRLNGSKWTFKRVTAMALCASMAMSSFASMLTPTLADVPTAASLRELYIREADKNTMDSYVQASLGGFIYSEFVDGVTSPTVRNNFGTRYAGEVWADLSVFARDQQVIAEIRPFEAEHDYTKMVTKDGKEIPEYQRAIATLDLEGALDNIKWSEIEGFHDLGIEDTTTLENHLAAGKTLTAAQAGALNDAVNQAIWNKYNEAGSGYRYAADGDFNGTALKLERHTDGYTGAITMSPDADFLNVFSVLGSSEILNDNVQLPLDVVFVLDTSSSMASHNSGAKYRLAKAAKALNEAFATVMTSNELNRVALLTYDTNVEEWLPLDRYEPIKTRQNHWTEGTNRPNKDNIELDDELKYPDNFEWDDYTNAYFVYDQKAAELDESVNSSAVGSANNNLDFAIYDNRGGVVYGDEDHWEQMKSLLRYIPSSDYSKYSYQYFQVNAQSTTAEGNYKKYTDWIGIHSGTNTHQALYEGLNKFFVDDAIEYATVDTVFGERDIPRVPVVILISDGAPSLVTTTDPDAVKVGTAEKSVGKMQGWWEPNDPPTIPSVPDTSSTTNPRKVIGTPSYGGWGTAIPVLLMAAHMKQKLNAEYTKFYEDNLEADAAAIFPGVKIVTIAVDSLGVLNVQPTLLGEPDMMKTLLNPAERLTEDFIQTPEKYETDMDPAKVSSEYTERIYETLLLYFGEYDEYRERTVKNDSAYDSQHNGYDLDENQEIIPETLSLDKRKLQVGDSAYWATIVPPSSSYKVYELSWETIKYNDLYVDANVDDLGTELFNIISRLRYAGTIFTPVTGENAAGVEDSLTYVNPIGKYMSLDSVTDAVLFGERYQLEPYAVYDYQVNKKIREQLGTGEYITEGWYSETKDSEGNITYHLETLSDGTAEQARARGWTYRIRYDTAVELIPTLKDINIDHADELRDKQPKMANTTYTLYTITKVYIGDTPVPLGQDPNHKENPTQRVNISYELQKDVYDDVNGPTTDENFVSVTFDLVDDVKIWLEDTGDYKDKDENGLLVSPDFIEALYVNIGVKALPTQVARIDLNPETFIPIRYKTNLDNTSASTPLRIFYNTRFDPDYLRYSVDDNGAHIKANAVGVAMAAIDGAYLSKNTGNYIKDDNDGFYNKVANASADSDVGRYTVFYNTLFSNTPYKDYPVMKDETKTSRGNATVTFSPDRENQFYRFQKNRVLFLIPGTYDPDNNIDRPAEIDLGDPKTVWLDNGKNIYIQSSETVGETTSDVFRDRAGTKYELVPGSMSVKGDKAQITVSENSVDIRQLDPTNFEDLLFLLNAHREDLNWNGTGDSKSTFASFGECIAVDGGPDLVLPGGQTQPRIDSDNWYYIIREFYFPLEFEPEKDKDGIVIPNGDKVAYDVQLCYMAIPRKGNEFGSGVDTNGDKTMGSEIEWYAPGCKISKEQAAAGYGNTAAFTAGASYGEPGVGGKDPTKDPSENYVPDPENPVRSPSEEQGTSFHWYISAKPGGLRVGGLANFAGVKSYSIREGVSDGTFTGHGSKVDRSNVTETSLTYFLPTIGTADTYVGSGSGIVVNIYLGNNGRILVEETVLLVTKMVQYLDANNDLQNDPDNPELFKYTVKIVVNEAEGEGITGERFAARVFWDDTAQTWRRIIESIEAVTDNEGYLEKSKMDDPEKQIRIWDGGTVTANYNVINNEDSDLLQVQYNGRAYYLQVPGNTIGNANVYQYNENDPDDPYKQQDGKMIYFWKEVELVPVAGGAHETVWIAIAAIDTSVGGQNGSAIDLKSACDISFEYLSKPVVFDRDTFTATFYLRSGEGLLFNGIPNGAEFTVTEMLTDNETNWNEDDQYEKENLNKDQYGEGWRFISANGVTASGEPGDGYKYEFTDGGANHTYTVSGETDSIGERAVHYKNLTTDTFVVLKGDKTLTLMPANANVTLADEEYIFELIAGDVYDSPDTQRPGEKSPWPDGAEVNQKVKRKADGTEYVETTLDKIEDLYGTFAFDRITFKKEGTYHYTIKETDTGKAGYTYDTTEYEVEVKVEKVNREFNGNTISVLAVTSITVTPDPNDETIQAAFNNLYNEPVNLTISKTVFDLEDDKEFTFDVKLTPPAGVTLKGPYRCSFADGTPAEALELTKEADGTYTGSLTLKDGQSITIHDLPYGTEYFIEEQADGTYFTIVDVNGVRRVIGRDVDGKLDDDETNVKFTNTSTLNGIFISKTVKGINVDLARDYEFTFTVKITDKDGKPIQGVKLQDGVETDENGEGTITLRHNEVVHIEDLPEGAKVTVTEEPVIPGFGVTVTADKLPDGTEIGKGGNSITVDVPKPEEGAGEVGQGVYISFLNEYATGNLEIKKTVEGVVEREYFTFEITLSYEGEDGDKTALDREYGYTGKVEDHGDDDSLGVDADGKKIITFKDGKAIVKLKDGQNIIISDLPANIHYTVVEKEAYDGYDTTVKGGEGTIPKDGTAHAEFTNTGDNPPPPPPPTTEKTTGNLAVSKTVTGNEGDLNKEFHFVVELSDHSINGPYGDLTFVNGRAEFTLKDSEVKTARGLPSGITYTVTEIEANQDGYKTSSTGSGGRIPAGGTAEASFVNDKDNTPPVGSLTVSKTVTGNTGERNKQFHFTVELSDRTINGAYGDVTFVNGVANITLRHGESKTIRDLPDGVTYTVTEAEANQDGYKTSASGGSGTIDKGWHNLASFVNNRDNPDIPKTGDESQFALWMVMLGLSLTGLLISLFYTMRENVPVGVRGGKRLKGIKGKRLKR